MNEAALNSIVPVIGTILKIFREKTRKNQSEIAQKAGISISMLSQIERGLVSPSIDTLFQVCEALGMEISDLFRRIASEPLVRVQRRGERLSTRRHGILFEQLATSAQVHHPGEMFLLELKPHGQAGLSGIGHEGIEMGYILEGSAVLTVAGIAYRLHEGDSISFNANVPHSLINAEKKTMRAIWAAIPPHKDYLETDS
jgi:transcriptional regulator with XRE-family HTH domain